ncbi:hypothetical protein HRI_003365100 [Hibiscus trionum]|uniref:Integrase catalytic domain-containing protein n=1 Tax=Hibiscus trionum TaxID=183268 RepID=A0A9W7IKJ2_HIBTR|nr:hypothetical protein HRI_003365100 [Hibiscus trionum]
MSLSTSKEDSVMLWHRRLGHPNFMYLKKLFPLLFLNKKISSLNCEVCQLSKHTCVPYPLKPYVQSQPFSLIHSDLWGASRVKNITGARWFITFIDDHTRVCWVYLLKEKSEVSRVFQNFHSMIRTQFNSNIHTLRTDNGREYFNSILSPYLSEQGIIHQSSCPDTPQQNGVSERKNRHLVAVARALMFTMDVPKYLWGEAVLTACYLINRLPSKVLNFQTPLHTLQKNFPLFRVPNLPTKTFGCKAFVHNHQPNRSKLDPRAHTCVFIGYSPTQKGYKCYSPTLHRMFVSLDVTFFENEPYFSASHLQGETLSEDETLNNLLILPQDSISPTTTTKPAENPTATVIPIISPTTTTKPAENPTATVIPVISPTTTTKPAENPTATVIPVLDPVFPISTVQQQETRVINHTNEEKQPLHSEKQQEKTQGLRVYSRRHQLPETKTAVPMPSLPEDCPGEEVSPPSPSIYLPIAVRKGTRSCTQHPISRFVSYGNLSKSYNAFISNVDSVETPKNIEEALKSTKWRQAVLEEIKALEDNGTWEISKLPTGKKTVGCKWIFTTKFKPDGSIDRYKARLVARGFTQTYGLDYEETFAPVAKLNTIRVLLSIAVNLEWPLIQLDVKNAFLNGELNEEVYMDFPPGFEGSKGQVCKLKKSLYGLKQSPRAWFNRFAKAMSSRHYIQGQADHTLFYKHTDNGKCCILIVYVDDIILTGDDSIEIERLKEFLSLEFQLKDLGNLRYFLGMEVARSKAGISISQKKYVLDLLSEVGLLGCKPAETPMEPNLKLGTDKDGEEVDRGRYQRLVGKLIYLSHTRPDIAFGVSVISQFMHAPREKHLEAAYRILRYLKGTPCKGLHFKKDVNRSIEVYTDADWAGVVNDRRSTSGYCSYVWGNLVTWRSKKQSVVARSSAEAEYRALSHGICEGMWLQRLMGELKLSYTKPITLYCDNQAVSIAHNPVHHDRTKHVEIDRHFITEKINKGEVCVSYLPTRQQVADVLTKSLSRKMFEEIMGKLGLINIYTPA